MRELRNQNDCFGGLNGDDTDDCEGEDAGFNFLGPMDDMLDDDMELEEWNKSLAEHKNFPGCYDNLGDFKDIKKEIQ